MLELGMHTDNWRTLGGSFELAVEKTVKYQMKHIEFSVINGQHFIQAMGYLPSVSMESNPCAIKRTLDERGIEVSQIDASFPMMGPEGSTHGVRYLQQAIRFAALQSVTTFSTFLYEFSPLGFDSWDAVVIIE